MKMIGTTMSTIMDSYTGMFKFYEVGGKVRDELLGLSNKDVDYVAVPCQEALDQKLTACEMFIVLCNYLKNEGFEIFLITSECFTVRAKFPKDYKYQGVADFVMARKKLDIFQELELLL